jgi:hypothetical protein
MVRYRIKSRQVEENEDCCEESPVVTELSEIGSYGCPGDVV